MANIKGKLIRGQAGSLIYREYRGEQIVQGKPRTHKSHRTEGTKKAAKIFGKAVKLAAGVRWGLGYICGKYYDGSMIYRLNTEILRCVTVAKDSETQEFNFNAGSFSTLAAFEFNTNSMVKNHFFVRPIVTIEGNSLKITIPEMKIPVEIKSPVDRLKSCRFIMAVAMIDLEKQLVKDVEPQLMDIPYTFMSSIVPEQTFRFEILPGSLCVSAISIQYVEETFAGESVLNNKSFNPAAILHAHITDGTLTADNVKGWHSFK